VPCVNSKQHTKLSLLNYERRILSVVSEVSLERNVSVISDVNVERLLSCSVDVSKVTDIHAVLEITVYDEDPDKKVEFLGKLAIPLLQVKPPRCCRRIVPMLVFFTGSIARSANLPVFSLLRGRF